jgi:hypothetical protein
VITKAWYTLSSLDEKQSSKPMHQRKTIWYCAVLFLSLLITAITVGLFFSVKNKTASAALPSSDSSLNDGTGQRTSSASTNSTTRANGLMTLK